MPKIRKDEKQKDVYYLVETEQEKVNRLLKERNKLLEDVILELQEKLKQIDKSWKPKNDLTKIK